MQNGREFIWFSQRRIRRRFRAVYLIVYFLRPLNVSKRCEQRTHNGRSGFQASRSLLFSPRNKWREYKNALPRLTAL